MKEFPRICDPRRDELNFPLFIVFLGIFTPAVLFQEYSASGAERSDAVGQLDSHLTCSIHQDGLKNSGTLLQKPPTTTDIIILNTDTPSPQ